MAISLDAALSGLLQQQQNLENISNNLANANTTGYKRLRVHFQDILTTEQILATLNPAVQPPATSAGVTTAAVERDFTPGGLRASDNPLDMAIKGGGFFIVTDGTNNFYTRDGSFRLDSEGNLVNAAGHRVLAWQADADGNIDTTGAPQPFSLQASLVDGLLPARATTFVSLTGNLDSDLTKDVKVGFSASVLNSLGKEVPLALLFSRTGVNAWSVEVHKLGKTPKDDTVVGSGSVTFDQNGLAAPDDQTFSLNFDPGDGADPMSVTFQLGKLHQLDDTSSVSTLERDGFPEGTLAHLEIGAGGDIVGVFSNHAKLSLGRIALANFINPVGLNSVGENEFAASANSGEPQVGAPGDNGLGSVVGSSLESSNVDMGEEMTNLLVAQRAYQFNLAAYQTAQEMLRMINNAVV